jgi:hypothetical protein
MAQYLLILVSCGVFGISVLIYALTALKFDR